MKIPSAFIDDDFLGYEEPLIQFVDQMIQDAEEQGASDLHFEPSKDQLRIRYRRDGLLYESRCIPLSLAERVNTRLKVMADLDIAERRLPQDGRFFINRPSQQALDVRLSTCPTIHGEKIVLRFLNSTTLTTLDSLGMDSEQKKLFLEAITRPQGLILVTGPTGSGKTTTLYSALHHLNTPEKNILTLEDPVEIQLDGINQIHIHPKSGLDFAIALRALLRQDPDILMIGEIRDRETAEIAVQASQTGHLVLSTLHTNSACETLIRLLSMGIPSYQLTESLTLILSQRLLRKYCLYCQKTGCAHCQQGYRGRTAIFECLPLCGSLFEDSLKTPDARFLLKRAQNLGFRTLFEVGMKKVKQGETSLAELYRILPKEEN